LSHEPVRAAPEEESCAAVATTEESRVPILATPGARAQLLELVGATEVLAVVAHPDDESFGLGGLLASLVDSGLSVRLLCLTAGESSTIGAAEDLGARRAGELEAAARLLGVSGVHLEGLPDGGLVGIGLDRLCALIEEHLGAADALVVFEPHGVTGHADHCAATAAAESVAAAHGLPSLEWGVSTGVAGRLREQYGAPLRGLDEPGHWPTELVVNRSRQRSAICCHASQDPDNPLLTERLILEADRELVFVKPAPHKARLTRFVAQVGPLLDADAGLNDRRRALELLIGLAAGTAWPDTMLHSDDRLGYGLHTLHEDPSGWSLTAVVTRRGGASPPTSHSSWGATATLLGIERSTHLEQSDPGLRAGADEQLVARGGGYLLSPLEVRESSDASGTQTVSLRLLARVREP
jgi:LmbE family N-acetylglucosaminyl deacetylase/predicted metal-dependent enzyme (double-stranded beta helix superfamily)